MNKLNPGTIRVQLYDGREFTFASGTTPDAVIDTLRVAGVKPGQIKNTIHVIPPLAPGPTLLNVQIRAGTPPDDILE